MYYSLFIHHHHRLLFLPLSDIRKTFTISPTSIRAQLGGRAELQCSAPSALPPAKIAWYKNNVPITPEHPIVITPEGSLHIEQISLQVSNNRNCSYCLCFKLDKNWVLELVIPKANYCCHWTDEASLFSPVPIQMIQWHDSETSAAQHASLTHKNVHLASNKSKFHADVQ